MTEDNRPEPPSIGDERDTLPGFLDFQRATLPWTTDDPDADWRIEPGETTQDILDFYNGECARSREIVADASSLDEVAEHPRHQGWRMTRRWILAHMVEETARHVGHADILREQLDGATGE
jgi:Protein of unknown function (DUF664)